MKKYIMIFRGFGGIVFSSGMDQLSEKLKTKFPECTVNIDDYNNWKKYYDELKKSPDQIVLLGHSFGALSCYKIVSKLKHKKIPLVISFDYSPYYSGIVAHIPDGVVPKNVTKAINFYQKCDLLVRGVKMRREDGSEKDVTNILTKYSHIEIDKADELHDIVIKAIKDL
jgi:hypothetical protein